VKWLTISRVSPERLPFVAAQTSVTSRHRLTSDQLTSIACVATFYIALALFAVTVVLGFIGAMLSAEAWERTKAFLQIVIPVETLLIGGTSGHYFGNK
jgi:uncharacterized BrkB/YihY/UPF0761 family membrane protein